jgi:hypothetical protein
MSRAKRRPRRSEPGATNRAHTEAEIDDMANDGRLTAIAMRMAIAAGVDWPSLDGEEQDEWHEEAIQRLRTGTMRSDLRP